MPKLTPETRAARQRHILDAARRCFIRQGFTATTIQDICAEAGVSAGAVYTWFDSKKALVAALARRSLTDGTALLPHVESAASASGAPPADVLAAQATHLLADAAAGDDARLDLQLWAAGATDPDLGADCRASVAAMSGQMSRVAESMCAAGQLDPDLDAAAVGAVLTSVALGLEVQRALGVDLPVDAVARAIAALVDGRWSGAGAGTRLKEPT